jgi:8-oxo-dGTP pyrophosphatase MutT (NUDIX family)
MQLQPDDLRKIISELPKRQHAIPAYTPAAVLVIFFEREKSTFLIYIRRTKGMSVHSGHMAFPGGKVDPGDESNRATAFREAFEEIGIDATQLIYLGDLGLFETLTSRFDAAAHAVWSPQPLSYSPNPIEVAEVVEIPVSHLLSQFRPNLDFDNYDELMYLNFNYQPAQSAIANLWGLTARITHHFLSGLRRHLDFSR